jgi:hypothetical protein
VSLAAALAVGAFALARPAGLRANLNDTLVVRRATRDQVIFTEWMTGAVAALAALALVFGVIAPILLLGRGDPSVPAPTVTFQQARFPVAATVSIVADDVASDETMWVEMRTFGSADAPATLIARMSASGDREGRIDFAQTVAVNPRAAFFSVLIWFGDDERPNCTPTAVNQPGCTVLAVARRSAVTGADRPAAGTGSGSGGRGRDVADAEPGPGNVGDRRSEPERSGGDVASGDAAGRRLAVGHRSVGLGGLDRRRRAQRQVRRVTVSPRSCVHVSISR